MKAQTTRLLLLGSGLDSAQAVLLGLDRMDRGPVPTRTWLYRVQCASREWSPRYLEAFSADQPVGAEGGKVKRMEKMTEHIYQQARRRQRASSHSICLISNPSQISPPLTTYQTV
jgi:hypothetical protein